MSKISVDAFLDGIESIYVEQPKYQTGHDGSDGTCDCIGMPRGALKRKGVTNIKNFSGTNLAARKTIQDMKKIGSASELQLGDVVLKTRDKDDPDMPLPDRYRKGRADYDPTWGETNFTHIGTVTGVNPLVITHMTSPTAKKDTSLGNWKYVGKLPWVDYGEQPGPEPVTEWATVYAENGKPVKMRAKPSTSCRLYWEVPVGSQVMVLEPGKQWCHIQWAGQAGYMKTEFLIMEDGDDPGSEPTFMVIIRGLDMTQAKAISANYPGNSEIIEEG